MSDDDIAMLSCESNKMMAQYTLCMRQNIRAGPGIPGCTPHYCTVLHSKRVESEYGVVSAVYTRQTCMLSKQNWYRDMSVGLSKS